MKNLLFGALLACHAGLAVAQQAHEADIIVYGGTSAGVVAAVQAVKMGKSVILVSPDKHLGGLSSGGLGYTDSGKADSIGGLSREFYERVYSLYSGGGAWAWETQEAFLKVQGQGTKARNDNDKTQWLFEPHVAERVFEDWVKENNITVLRDRWLNREGGVTKANGRITRIATLDGATFTGKMFIDATYEGDLMAAAGVSYHVGREANSVYGETWNGVQPEAYKHHPHYFMAPVSPYKTPGDPASGLLPFISAAPPGKTGEADKRLQAYCFRLCMTRHPENRIPFPKPDNYNADDYLLMPRAWEGRKDFFTKFDKIPNLKTDTNNHGPLSSDFIGANYDYPEASYARRREIIKAHADYQKGLLYFASTDARMPAHIREPLAQWGLAKDEFTDNGGWPHQIYVREARRMIGVHVMTEHDTLSKTQVADPIGMGSYTLDSHNCQRYITADGHVQNEGDVGVGTKGPYRISYGSILPKKGECANLLVPVCLSSSHIAYGSIRMEPVFMILAQSAVTAAVHAIDEGRAVQDIDYAKLAERLKADKQRF